MQNELIMEDTFKEYGLDFQTKSIAAMLDDKVFLSKIADIIKPTYYDTDGHKFIVQEISKYYIEYKQQPTKDVIAVRISNLDRDDLRSQCKVLFLDIIKRRGSNDQTFIKDSVVEFCKNQAIKNVIIESVDLLKIKKYDLIKSKLDLALNVGIDTNIGHDYVLNFEDRYKEDLRDPIETPWPFINEITRGGLGTGDLGVIMGLQGAGKCVGPNTEIEIEYTEFGIDIKTNSGNTIVMWIKPWETFKINNIITTGWEIYKLVKLTESIV